jgi:uncharacterized protein YcfJ
MLKKLSFAGAAIAMTATALVPATPAMAQSRHYDSRNYDRGYYDNGYTNDARTYRGENYNRYRAQRRCKSGDTGTIVGAIAGGLLGRVVTGRNDRLLGTVLGAGAGALAGRAVERSDRPDYCRR